MAKLKKELLEPAAGSGGGGEGRGFDVHKVGDARVGFVGAQYPCAQIHVVEALPPFARCSEVCWDQGLAACCSAKDSTIARRLSVRGQVDAAH